MKNYIKFLGDINLTETFKTERNKEINILFSIVTQKVIEIILTNSEILTKHLIPTAITVLCLGGNGVFKAGENLEVEKKLTAGTLIYLEKDIFHEVVAQPNLRILVTKLA